LNNKPKHRLFANSLISSIVYDPNDINIIYGGLSNGQVVKWDVREKKYPILSTKINETKHIFAVNGLEVN